MTLPQAVVIEYLGDRDKSIVPNLMPRKFVPNPDYDDRRVIVEFQSDVVDFCLRSPQMFRRATDIEDDIRQNELFDAVAADPARFATLLKPFFAPLKAPAKRTPKKAKKTGK
tara:strand:- start:797 stop:1132 length:336 start_codon:yes stop_codon:yes gene_type:complete